MTIDDDIKEANESIKSLGSLVKDLNLVKINIRWGLDIALLSGSFFLFFESLLNYQSEPYWKIILFNLISWIFLADFVLTSVRYNNQIKKLQNIKDGINKNLLSLETIKKNENLSGIYNKVFHKKINK